MQVIRTLNNDKVIEMANSKQTSKSVASTAAQTLNNPNASAIQKKLGWFGLGSIRYKQTDWRFNGIKGFSSFR